MYYFPISGTLLAAGLAGLVVASVSDFREHLIYNETVLYLLGVGIALRLVSTPELLWVSIAGALILLVLLGLLARFDLIGGGDAKLIAVTMLLVPPRDDAQLIVDIAVAGGVLSCVYLAVRVALKGRVPVPVQAIHGSFVRQWRGLFANELINISAGEPMPYALAILAGTAYAIGSEVFQCISAISCSL